MKKDTKILIKEARMAKQIKERQVKERRLRKQLDRASKARR